MLPAARTATGVPGRSTAVSSAVDSVSRAHCPGEAASCQPVGSPGTAVAEFDAHDSATEAPPAGPMAFSDSQLVVTWPETAATISPPALIEGPAPAPRGATLKPPTDAQAPLARCTSTRYSRAVMSLAPMRVHPATSGPLHTSSWRLTSTTRTGISAVVRNDGTER